MKRNFLEGAFWYVSYYIHFCVPGDFWNGTIYIAERLRFVTVLSIGVVADLTTTLLVGLYVQVTF
jgi:hypothetical protein